MLVDHVGMWDREGAEKKKEIQSYIRLIEISQSVPMKSQYFASFVGSQELVTALAVQVI
jgi:hypothetical protein